MKNPKNLYLICHIVIGILAIAIVPASVFLMHIPGNATIFLCAGFILTYILCLILTVKKLGGRILLTILSLFTVILSVFGNYCNPYWNSITLKGYDSFYSLPMDTVLSAEDAKEDLEYAMYYLKKLHPAFYTGIPEQAEQRYEAVLADISKADKISVCELAQKIEYILSVMRDGHSYVKILTEDAHYMKDIYQFNQSNCTVTVINGIELSELLKQTEDLYSYEVESWQLRGLKNDLSSLEGLQYLGFNADEGITYTYASEDGVKSDHTYYTKDFILYNEYVEYNHIENAPNGYGDIAMFALPNSQLFMQISTKQFFRIDQDNPSDLVEPDIPCENDNAMEVLYDTIAD